MCISLKNLLCIIILVSLRLINVEEAIKYSI